MDDTLKTIRIDGSRFSDKESFYQEMSEIFTKTLKLKVGRNLNAFNDLLIGGFGVFKYEEPINLVWTNFNKSKQNLGSEFVGWIVEIISKHHHINFYIVD